MARPPTRPECRTMSTSRLATVRVADVVAIELDDLSRVDPLRAELRRRLCSRRASRRARPRSRRGARFLLLSCRDLGAIRVHHVDWHAVNLAQGARDHAGISDDDDVQPVGMKVLLCGAKHVLPSSRRALVLGTRRSSLRQFVDHEVARAPWRSPPSSRSGSERRHRGSSSRASVRLSLIGAVRMRSISFRISRTAAPVTSLFTAVWIVNGPARASPLERGERAVGVAVRLAQVEVDARGEESAEHGVHHRDGEVVGVAARKSDVADAHLRLRRIALGDDANQPLRRCRVDRSARSWRTSPPCQSPNSCSHSAPRVLDRHVAGEHERRRRMAGSARA